MRTDGFPRGLATAQREADFSDYLLGSSIFNALHWMMPDIVRFWYYVPVIIAGSPPWLGSRPGARYRGWKKPQAFRNRRSVELDDNAAAVFLRR
ncbi:hypothetical protein ACLB1M_18160 [Escherichia coli]